MAALSSDAVTSSSVRPPPLRPRNGSRPGHDDLVKLAGGGRGTCLRVPRGSLGTVLLGAAARTRPAGGRRGRSPAPQWPHSAYLPEQAAAPAPRPARAG